MGNGGCVRGSVSAYAAIAPRLVVLHMQYIPFEDVYRCSQTEIVDEFIAMYWVAQIVKPRRDLLRVLGIPVHVAQKVAEASFRGEGGDVFEVVAALVLGQICEVDVFLVQRPNHVRPVSYGQPVQEMEDRGITSVNMRRVRDRSDCAPFPF